MKYDRELNKKLILMHLENKVLNQDCAELWRSCPPLEEDVRKASRWAKMVMDNLVWAEDLNEELKDE